MNYQVFTNESLLMMHHGAKGALAVDDELGGLGQQPRFRVRETPDWVTHAAELEAEMLRRGVNFDPIKWAERELSASDSSDSPTVPAAPQTDPAASSEGHAAEAPAPLRNRIAAALKLRLTN
jgi:hypothetical protein